MNQLTISLLKQRTGMYDNDSDMAQDHMYYVSTRDLGGEPLHDPNRSLDQPQSELDQHRDAEATRAYARQGQPDDPNNDADEGQDEREEREGEAQEEPEGPAFAALVVAAAAAHGGRGPSFAFRSGNSSAG